jgi:serine/threonine protein kinase
MITPECSIKICDFGLSRSFDEEIGNSVQNEHNKRELSPVICSRWYRPPEVIMCTDYNSKADMWSIGCVIGELALKVSNPKKDYR